MRERSARGSIWLALIACLVLQAATGAKTAPDLSGSWVRDATASDDPVEKAGAQNVQTSTPRRRPWGISFPGGVWYPGSGRGPSAWRPRRRLRRTVGHSRRWLTG